MYDKHHIKYASFIDGVKENKVMRMDYLHAVEIADNMMEIYNLIKLINIELGKFNSGEYTDEEYHTQLIEALNLAEKRQFEV
jgi:hypothetical protein